MTDMDRWIRLNVGGKVWLGECAQNFKACVDLHDHEADAVQGTRVVLRPPLRDGFAAE